MNSTNVTEENVGKVDPKDYKIIRDMIKEMDEWNHMLYDDTVFTLSTMYGLKESALFGIAKLNDEDIEHITEEQVNEFYTMYGSEEHIGNRPEMNTDDERVTVMKEIKVLQKNIYEATDEANKLKAESDNILNEYFEYLSSPEVQEARRKRLAKMKELAETERDELKKKKMLSMINTMELSENFGFIFKRIDALGNKELKSIMYGFFTEKKGSYIISRYKARVAKFGFSPDLYKYFFNLEEKFLDEKYHAYNNLFLFNYMRFVAYSDPYNKSDKLFVQTLTSTMANLIYHKFPSTENERYFIHIIEKFDEKFRDSYDYFMDNNTTRPDHPIRIQASKKYEEDRKVHLIRKMDELGITGYENDWSANDLQKYMNDELEKINEKERESRKSNVVQHEDGHVEISPDMNKTPETIVLDSVDTYVSGENE